MVVILSPQNESAYLRVRNQLECQTCTKARDPDRKPQIDAVGVLFGLCCCCHGHCGDGRLGGQRQNGYECHCVARSRERDDQLNTIPSNTEGKVVQSGQGADGETLRGLS